MIKKSVYFLAGLPRTGSTLLGSILSQNPQIHVTPTSPLYPLLVATNEHFNLLNIQYTFDHEKVSNRVYHAMIEAFYAGIEEPIIFDKHRGWPKHCAAISEYINPVPRIICTVRPIAEIITSYLVLAEQDEENFIDAHLRKINQRVDNESRAFLLWTEYLKLPYESLKQGLQTHRENILLIDYRDIVFSIEKTMNKIYDFCGIDPASHDFCDIKNECAEAKDEAWGLKNLHTIRPSLSMQSASPESYLPKAAVEYFRQFDVGAV